MLDRIFSAFKAPNRALHGFLVLIGIVGSMWVSEAILVRNQSNYVYPPDGDSIGIPLMGMMFYNIAVFLLLLIVFSIVRGGRVGRAIGMALAGLLSLGHLMQILDWADANHFLIGLAQGFVGAQMLVYVVLEYRRGVVR